MRVRKLTSSGDYSFGHGNADFYQDVPQAVGQVARTFFLLWLGEYYWDTSLGTPFMQGIFGKHSQAEADATTRDRLLDSQGVTGISNSGFKSTLDADRNYVASVDLDTIYGPTTIELQNQLNY